MSLGEIHSPNPLPHKSLSARDVTPNLAEKLLDRNARDHMSVRQFPTHPAIMRGYF